GLKCAPEAFHVGVVVAVVFAAHAGGDATRGEQSLIACARVLQPLVAVVQQSRTELSVAARKGLTQRSQSITQTRPPRIPPDAFEGADDAAGDKVPFVRRDVGERVESDGEVE